MTDKIDTLVKRLRERSKALAILAPMRSYLYRINAGFFGSSSLQSRRRLRLFEHTPGPWVYGIAKNGDVGIKADGAGVFAISYTDIHYPYENAHLEALANGRLIAAAPDLLACAKLLESLCAWLLHCHGPNSREGKEAQFRLTAVRAAITKAEGDSHD